MPRNPSPAAYAGTTLALLALLALTTATAYRNLGPLNLPMALLIASAKALLVFLFFMHLWHGSAAFRIAALLGCFMLAVFGVLTMSDYGTRTRDGQRVLPVRQSEVPLGSEPAPLSSGPPERQPPPVSERAPRRN